MRLAVFVSRLPPISRSGIGVSVSAECHSLAKAGCSVHVFTASEAALSVPEVVLKPLARDVFPKELPDCDILHLHSLGMATVALEAAQRLQLPLVYTAHSLIERELPQAQEWIRVQHRVMAAAHHVFFLNRMEQAYSQMHIASLRGKSSVRSHGSVSAASEPGARQRKPLIVIAGRLCKNKGTDLAVAALRLVMRAEPSVSALFAGPQGDEDCEAAVADLIAEFPRRVERSGWLERGDLMKTLRHARMALCPSRYEPFGLLPIEALQLGTPVLAAASEGACETLPGAPGVALLQSDDAPAWSRAILHEWRSGALLADAQRSGAAWIAERFDPERQTNLLIRTLQNVQSGFHVGARKAQVPCHVA
ncbi:glycosyltransferase family 4 protein [Occallatibacter riparius]|uniref:Glycosyltransferase family 4 protein n=1 Tax=Occallatibacter riparius TaxID=1002689 RepID=A0A9J7BWV7_9BACT|nr:glycosyltransferase family 4 protein [Occallatibacter riparius]UWZ85525.1 glycosyltransferase family 4 protein [Occallatibacter riparius]